MALKNSLWYQMERVLSSKLAAQINLHTSRRRRVVAQNSKISRFRENKISCRGSILTLFFTKPPQLTIFPKCDWKIRFEKTFVGFLYKRLIKKRELWISQKIQSSSNILAILSHETTAGTFFFQNAAKNFDLKKRTQGPFAKTSYQKERVLNFTEDSIRHQYV